MPTNLILGVALGSSTAAGWSPQNLGSSLLAWWDSSSGVSLSGSAVTAWADVKAGYSAAQAVSGSRPVYGATSFNGAPGVTFDGTDDYLEFASQPFPVAANPCEVWATVHQEALAADATNRTFFAFGGDTNTVQVRAQRFVVGGVNRPLAANGTTSAGSGVSVAFDTRHVYSAQFTATDLSVTLDGSAKQTAAGVPNIGTSRTRIGAVANPTASQFWQGKIRDIVVTAPLSAGDASLLQQFLMARRML